MTSTALLEVEGLRLEVVDAGSKPPLVEDMHFQLHAGRTLALVGESGSGKSLTALSIMGLLPFGVRRAAGKVRFQGTELTTLKESALRKYRGAKVAYIFQDPSAALNPVLRVGKQVEEVLQAHRPKLSRVARRARVLELLQEVDLPDGAVLARRYPHQLSGGQRQRVLIAAALAGEPEVLIADEPTTALDVTVQEQILGLLERLRVERGLAMLWISHDLQLVRAFCQEALVMRHGKVVERGAPKDLFENPQHAYTQELVRAALAGQIAKPAEEDAPDEAPSVCRVFGMQVRYPGPNGGKKDSFVAVKGVDFRIHPGETLALVGESGSGKTSVGRALLRLVPMEKGQVMMHLPNGKEVDWASLSQAQLRPLRRHVGMVFQDPVSALDPRMRAWQSVSEPLAIHKVAKGRELRKRALALLADVGLGPDQADAFPNQLSGGQCQRVAIARAIALQPSLVVCDEAISALDANIQEQILELLADLQALRGIAYLFITHDLDAVRRFSDRVAVMKQGEIVEQGLTSEVLKSPEHPYTKRLLDAAAAVHSSQ
ncbi:MAG: ABC transporter ATP-binding protein [Planctomycetota bacterium]|nr:ABC transporter ATP-binding protein [Planctomycetota bacterium]MDA1114419.1 ABC transporter ATP-binding protein [Planctomycetota bacterium]